MTNFLVFSRMMVIATLGLSLAACSQFKPQESLKTALESETSEDAENGADEVPGVVNPPPIVLKTSFQGLNTNIIPKCNLCHAGAAPSGGITFANYSEVLRFSIPKNPAASPLLSASRRIGPPPAGNGLITAAELQYVSDWIAEGALNN